MGVCRVHQQAAEASMISDNDLTYMLRLTDLDVAFGPNLITAWTEGAVLIWKVSWQITNLPHKTGITLKRKMPIAASITASCAMTLSLPDREKDDQPCISGL